MRKPKKKEENKVEYGTISLPKPLISKIKIRIKGTGMPSVSAYVAFVLRQIISSSKKTEGVLDKDEELEVKNGLKSLGYLDLIYSTIEIFKYHYYV